MNRDKELIEMLQHLARYEIDATFIIAQGIACITDKTLRNKLSKMREECEKNVKTISDIIIKYGGEVPEHSHDFKGFFMQGYVGMRGLISDQGAMTALATNTRMLISAFDDALSKDIPSAIQKKLETIFDIAKRHLKYFVSKS
jgi:uncharacterized protein (TIGR02284 family)